MSRRLQPLQFRAEAALARAALADGVLGRGCRDRAGGGGLVEHTAEFGVGIAVVVGEGPRRHHGHAGGAQAGEEFLREADAGEGQDPPPVQRRRADLFEPRP